MAVQQFNADLIYPAQAILGEGPIWDPRCSSFWWIDIEAKRLFQFSPDTGKNLMWQLDEMPGAVVARKQGGLILALEHGFGSFDPESAEIEVLGDPERDVPNNRFNDGKCDPAGRFWAGTMRIEDHMEIHTGSLYSLETNGKIIKRIGGDIGVSNGIVWSSDASRMYFVDSPTREIFRFDYDLESGDIKNRECIFHAPDEFGFPDGMTIDTDDKLWVAFWGGWCVAKICPETSKILAKVSVPVEAPTACAFGGPNHDQLLITTASIGLSQNDRVLQPLAGDLFMANVEAEGVLQPEYAG